jgi:hypothetical protein
MPPSGRSGRITAAITGTPAGPGFSTGFVRDLAAGRWEQAWPGVPPTLAATVYTGLLAAAAAPLVAGWTVWRRRRARAGDPLPSLATGRQLAGLTPAGATKRARSCAPPSPAPPPGGWRPRRPGCRWAS